jgi:molybdate transport system substrate-binding protein
MVQHLFPVRLLRNGAHFNWPLQATELQKFFITISLLLALLAVLPLTVSCSNSEHDLSIFAAAGARAPLDEIIQQFQAKYGTAVEISYGGGGEVLNQMVFSKSGDLYVAPEQRFMQTAAEKHAIDPGTVKSIAYMVPVIAVQKGNPLNISNLADLAKPGTRVAITRPETTLLGKYAPGIFSKAGLAEAIGKNVMTEAARPDNLLAMLVMGQVDAGIVWHFYQTQAPDRVQVIFLAPEQLTGIGEMQIAVASYCRDKKAAGRFIGFITSDSGREVFRRHGYFTSVEEVSQCWHQGQ